MMLASLKSYLMAVDKSEHSKAAASMSSIEAAGV